PLNLPLQGVIRDNAGVPVVEDVFQVTFALYDTVDAVDPVWTESWPAGDEDCAVAPDGCVHVVNGRFRLALGAHNPLDVSVLEAASGLWLGMSVEGEPELERRPLGSAPYALLSSRAKVANTALGLNCTGCIAPEALSNETVLDLLDTTLLAVQNEGYVHESNLNAGAVPYDGLGSELAASDVQSAIDELKALIAANTEALSAGPGDVVEGAGSVSRYTNQWGLPSYGTAVEYIHLMNPNPAKVLLHLYGGENTGFASSNNLIVSNSYTPNTFSGEANGSAGDDTLTVANAGAFNQGDHILIHQSVGTGTGNWELNAVQAINGNSLKLAKALTHSYVSQDGDAAQRAQVVIAASYSNFEVVNGGEVFPSDYMGSGSSSSLYGGIVYIRARQLTVKNGGSIHADHRGYDAGGWDGWYTPSIAGRSECHTGGLSQDARNCSGGGAGWPHSNGSDCNTGGGGGGNKTAGADGQNGGCYTVGQGGSAKGSDDGSELQFGGGGGSSYPHGGGRGGGSVVLGADTLIVESGARISANGDAGQPYPHTSSHGGVGGGAGGTVAIFANNIDVQGVLEANGGPGGQGCNGNGCAGGQGGDGWIFQGPPIPGIVNQSYATGVEIWVDGEEVTPTVGDPNAKGL
ncbi:MAG: hypothetical protein VX938_06605, partial [Myxococcota bacterium]|nr:hypothetical protein [Myxococcota bacterium]